MHAIEFDNVTFSYGNSPSPILRSVSFCVEEGEFVALVGDNGSGKSTIARMCDAFLAPNEGIVRVLGHDIGQISSTDDLFALRSEVGFVFQNPDDQLVASLVIDEVAFGPRNLGLPRAEVFERIDEALRATGMADAIGHDVNTLSGGQRQRIAIADALAMRPRLLILDEPTSMIDAAGRLAIMEVVERLHASGMAILLITHNPTEAARADRVLHMSDGSVTDAKPCPTFQPHSSPIASAASTHRQEATSAPADPIIRFERVSFRYDEGPSFGIGMMSASQAAPSVLNDLDLDVYEGELLAIAGPNGSGKTTLIQHMNGLLRPSAGRVLVNGTDTATKAGANQARRIVGVSFQYPERSLFAEAVHDEIAFGPRNLGLREDEVDERVRTAALQLALPYEQFAQRNPFDLSGGEQRKVAIASVLAMRPRVLVLDEPCASMDARAHDHLIGLLASLKSAGQTIVLVTHEESDIALLADRVFRLGHAAHGRDVESESPTHEHAASSPANPQKS